ncbi:hypothetical protein LINGRAPRIM_LOCUS3015 [Linum grandiflorum]
MDHYLHGMRIQIYHLLSPQTWTSREDVYNAALRVERAERALQEEKDANKDVGKRKIPSQLEGHMLSVQSKRRVVGSFAQGQTQTGAGSTMSAPTMMGYPNCDECGRRHLGECKIHLGVCFTCGEPGHIQRNCPNRRSRGRTYSEQTVMGGKTNTGNQTGNQSNHGNSSNSGRNKNYDDQKEQSQASRAGGRPRLFAMRGGRGDATSEQEMGTSI